jgi:uncharacterized phage protein (TIGR01671 family)
MREIKFRAWIKGHTKLFNIVVEPHMTEEFDFVAFDGEYFVPEGVGIYNMEIMQYTGLKDKNGKEIYEGDIINLSSWEPSVYLVAWDRGAFYMAKKNLEEVGDIKYVESGEIIGNIYENPELLTPNTQ